MARKLFALTLVTILTGCSGQQLKPELMGSTARCLHNVDTKYEKGSVAQQRARNECMWAKADDAKD